jgi:hypothetical protein
MTQQLTSDKLREYVEIGAGYIVQTRGGGSTFRIRGPGKPYVIVTSEYDHPFYTTMARAIKAEREANAAEVLALRAENDKLRAAISWIEPPFIDSNTSEIEIRKRIGFCVQDAKRAALTTKVTKT